MGTICTPLEMIASDDKKRKIQSANVEGLFRIIQSIPSPKAEPFKRWLAKVGSINLNSFQVLNIVLTIIHRFRNKFGMTNTY